MFSSWLQGRRLWSHSEKQSFHAGSVKMRSHSKRVGPHDGGLWNRPRRRLPPAERTKATSEFRMSDEQTEALWHWHQSLWKTCGFLLTHQFNFPFGYLSWSPWRQKTISSFWSSILSARDSMSLYEHHGDFGDQDLYTYYLIIYWLYHLDNMCPHVSRLLSGVCVFFKSGTEAAGE